VDENHKAILVGVVGLLGIGIASLQALRYRKNLNELAGITSELIEEIQQYEYDQRFAEMMSHYD
jgi:hypothetical protein